MPPHITLKLLVWLPILWLVVLLVSGAVVIIGKRGSRREVARVAQARRTESFATFAADFAPDYPAPEILLAVYNSLQRAVEAHQLIEGFVARADDELAAVYDAYLVDDWNDLNDLDLRDLVGEAARRCDRRLPEPEEIRVRVKLRTVRDMVEYLEQCPRISGAQP